MKKDLIKTNGQKLGISQKQWDIIGSKTPQDKIRKRPGRGGQLFDYVETGYMVGLLNTVFNGLWDFEVTDQQVGTTQVWVRGKLTVYISPELKITKTQYGGSDVKKDRNGNLIDIADDLKAASSDCLKKCASLFGFASDIYWKEKPQKDMDGQKPEEIVGIGKITEKQVKFINVLCSQKGVGREELKKKLNVASMKDLSLEQAKKTIDELLKIPDINPKAEF